MRSRATASNLGSMDSSRLNTSSIPACARENLSNSALSSLVIRSGGNNMPGMQMIFLEPRAANVSNPSLIRGTADPRKPLSKSLPERRRFSSTASKLNSSTVGVSRLSWPHSITAILSVIRLVLAFERYRKARADRPAPQRSPGHGLRGWAMARLYRIEAFGKAERAGMGVCA